MALADNNTTTMLTSIIEQSRLCDFQVRTMQHQLCVKITILMPINTLHVISKSKYYWKVFITASFLKSCGFAMTKLFAKRVCYLAFYFRAHFVLYFKNWTIPGLFFIYSIQLIAGKFCWCLDSGVSEAITLPTKPQPLACSSFLWWKIIFTVRRPLVLYRERFN